MSIISTLPPVEPFIPELLPDAIRDYVLDVADRQQAPPDFAAVTAVCGLAAVIGNRVRICPKQNDDWEVVPNLWGAIIGRPSAMKSPAMQSALGPIYTIQDELREEWEEKIRTAEIDDALASLDAKDAKKKAEKALTSGDREGARGILANLVEDDEEPPCPRIVVNDTTVEKLGELLNENPRGLLLIRDELPGFLTRLESEEHQSERAFYLEAYNGDGRFTYDRIGRGTVHIENCTVSIIGGVQPSRIAPIVRGAMSGTGNDGLIQRFQMTVWPDDRASWRWVDRKPDMKARLAYEKVFRDLFDLSMGDTDKPAILRFSPQSQALFEQWMTEIQAEARSGSLPSTLESHVLKMPKTVAALALLFELADGGRFEVNEVAMRRALGWADYLRSHANRLYSAGETMAENGARLIVERRHQLPEPFTPRDVQRKGWASLNDRDAVASAIDMLIGTHHCREIPSTGHPAGGRPSVAYSWNPSLKVEG
ncbi:YfjI family protein [Bradyrhizobium sp. YCK136]|uniref:YfjI family protein n=1 Tax=Bradyrhizobium sp. YCK136 TaxID=3351346 RepID=UPI0037C560CF